MNEQQLMNWLTKRCPWVSVEWHKCPTKYVKHAPFWVVGACVPRNGSSEFVAACRRSKMAALREAKKKVENSILAANERLGIKP